jgi:hypothetical protein
MEGTGSLVGLNIYISVSALKYHGIGGKLLNNETIVNYGLELVDGCMNTYNTAYGCRAS